MFIRSPPREDRLSFFGSFLRFSACDPRTRPVEFSHTCPVRFLPSVPTCAIRLPLGGVVNRSRLLLLVLASGASLFASLRLAESTDRPALVRGQDWPAWRHDAQRSATSKQEL